MSDDPLLLDVGGAVATITLNRPDKLNALTPEMEQLLFAMLRELEPGDRVRVIRVRGAGRAFCSGYDLTPGGEPYATESGSTATGNSLTGMGQSRISVDRERLRRSIDEWLWMWSYRKPIVAQIHGLCLSGGLDLIGACDIVWAAEDTKLGHPAARGMGIPRTMGMLPFRIGAAATKELMFTGDLIDAQEAFRLGLVTRMLPADVLEERTAEHCRRIALNSLDALTVHKHVVNRWFEVAGVRLAAQQGAEFDAILHESAVLSSFGDISAEHGLKAALAWRDGPFADDVG